MHKVKKKIAKETPIQIKTENEELKSLSHYIDDRVELIKQIFNSLKPKTIKSLAPSFMKKFSVEEIEELCLNELLGISKKRLTSIIDDTKCPSDTESSAESDVEVDEYISLEEISSDSEADHNRTNNKEAKKNGNKKGNLVKTQNEENHKEISVLELLELQARARAIRSQLALEPVTKIEVDTDGSNSSSDVRSEKLKISKVFELNKNKQEQNKNMLNQLKHENSLPNGNGENSMTSQAPKRIKLKRNFRKQCVSDDYGYNNTENSGNTHEQLPEENTENEEPTKKQNPTSDDKTNQHERSASPDVITILQSPETFCISDSSDGENTKNTHQSKHQKSHSDQSKEKQTVANGELMSTQVDNNIQNNKEDEENIHNIQESEKLVEKEPSEIEDGEILESDNASDDENNKQESNDSVVKIIEDSKSPEHSKDTSSVEQNHEELVQKEPIDKLRDAVPDDSSNKIDNEPDHQNDDVISLGNDDLDYEMRDPSDDDEKHEDEEKTKNLESNDYKDQDHSNEIVDFIELHDDSNSNQEQDDNNTPSIEENVDDKQTQSWNARWLNSSKISKILATSKLGNRVREKIKKSKLADQQQQIEKNEKTSKNSNSGTLNDNLTNLEDGTVQQYKQIKAKQKIRKK